MISKEKILEKIMDKVKQASVPGFYAIVEYGILEEIILNSITGEGERKVLTGVNPCLGCGRPPFAISFTDGYYREFIECRNEKCEIKGWMSSPSGKNWWNRVNPAPPQESEG